MSIEDRYQALIAAYDPSSVAHRIKTLRTAWEMSQSEFARLIGLAPNAVSQFEGAVSRPSQDVETRLKAAFGITVDWLRYGEMSGLGQELIRRLENAKVAIGPQRERKRDKKVPPPRARSIKQPSRRAPKKTKI